MKRRIVIPEVLQTSGMDCGPAALKALLAGLHLRVNYERLREECRTSADGTSLDVIEDLCVSLGLEASQEVAPIADAIAVLERRSPAIVAVKGPAGSPHFVVFWRTFGPWAQIMDPSRGRRWVSKQALTRSLFVHEQTFDEPMFQRWFPTTGWKAVLDARLRRLGVDAALPSLNAAEIIASDAAARLVDREDVRRRIAARERQAVFDHARRAEHADPEGLLPHSLTARAKNLDGRFACQGAVFLSVRNAPEGRRAATAKGDVDARRLLGPDGPSALQLLARQLTPGGWRLVALLAITSVLLTIVAGSEMIVLRAAFNAEGILALPQQRFAGTAIYGAIVLLMLTFELVTSRGVARLGLALEVRTRLAMLEKLRRLPDSYFRTRPMSDVAHRSRGLAELRPLPELVAAVWKSSLGLLVTLVALCIVYPRGIPITLVGLLFGVVTPFVGLALRQQVESRAQTHASALGHVYLDALLGLVPLRTHGGKHVLRGLQDATLVDWRRESERSVRLLSLTEAVQSIGILAVIVALVLDYARVHESQSALLLIVFWAMRLPLEARELSAQLQRVPLVHASLRRLVEPLTASETRSDEAPGSTAFVDEGGGLAVEARGLEVVLGGRRILSEVSFVIGRGERVAVVGTSGAGKSMMLATLLGVVEPTSGQVRIDGAPIERHTFERLRRETVWVDPTVQLWNRSMLSNLQFGNPAGERNGLDDVLERVRLKDVVERMPTGFATPLGESGARLSGGEGQRVRLARALVRRGARLILLDEAFRGLDRPSRRALSRSVREHARGVTVLEVTHDVADTRDFDRIIVIEDGKLIEEGTPGALLAQTSRYAELVKADLEVQRSVWDRPDFRRIRVEGGNITSEVVDARQG